MTFLVLKLFVTTLAWPPPVLDWGEDQSGIRCPHHLSQTVAHPSPAPRASAVCMVPPVHVPVPDLSSMLPPHLDHHAGSSASSVSFLGPQRGPRASRADPVPVLFTAPPGSPITLGTKSYPLGPVCGDLQQTEQDWPVEIPGTRALYSFPVVTGKHTNEKGKRNSRRRSSHFT